MIRLVAMRGHLITGKRLVVIQRRLLTSLKTVFDRPKDSLGKPGTSQDKPEENPDDQNCKRSPGNLWLLIDHQNESLLNRYIRIKGI